VRVQRTHRSGSRGFTVRNTQLQLDTFEWSVENRSAKDNLDESCRKIKGHPAITVPYFGLKAVGGRGERLMAREQFRMQRLRAMFNASP